MASTRIRRLILAPRERVFAALLDPAIIPQWKVPSDMTCEVHEFNPVEGGTLRVSLTYIAEDRQGKSEGRTDTYRGRLVKIVPNELVVEVDEFETDDPALAGALTSTFSLIDVDGATELVAMQEGLPDGLSTTDNEIGWNDAMNRLAALLTSSG